MQFHDGDYDARVVLRMHWIDIDSRLLLTGWGHTDLRKKSTFFGPNIFREFGISVSKF